MIPTDQSNEPC